MWADSSRPASARKCKMSQGDRSGDSLHAMNPGFRKFLLLWAGELISSIGGGLTSFGLGSACLQACWPTVMTGGF